MRVLLALNEKNSRQSEKIILDIFSPGDDVSCVSDQIELMSAIVSKPPDILIYNRYFPGDMIVKNALKAIKKASPRTRIIFLAGPLNQKAWTDCAEVRMMGIKDIIAWEKEEKFVSTKLINTVSNLLINPHTDADNVVMDSMLESMMGLRIRKPRVYVYGEIGRDLPPGVNKVDVPNDADLIVAAGDLEDAARFFSTLDCSVPIVMVSEFDDAEVKSLVMSNLAAIRPEMLDVFIKDFFFPEDESAPSPAPVKQAVQAAKAGGNIKAKFLALLKKWGGWRSTAEKLKSSRRAFLSGLGKKPDSLVDPIVNEDTTVDPRPVTKVSAQGHDRSWEHAEQQTPEFKDPDSVGFDPHAMPEKSAHRAFQAAEKAEQTEPAVPERAPEPALRAIVPEPPVRVPEREEPAVPAGFVAMGRVDGVSPGSTFTTVAEVVAAKPRAVLVSGTRWIKDLRREQSLLAVPIVVVGDNHDPSLCMVAGADECVSSLDQQAIDLILARVARMRDTWSQAETDGLTGCYNRKFLDRYLGEERRPFSILMCDLDHFKKVNDTYGHDAGDQVLRQFGQFLRDQVRQTDIVARYGGEEFVVLLPGATVEQAAGVAEKICSGWREQVIETDSGVVYSTVSIGVAGPGPDALKAADQAAYRAKEAGRDRWARFDQVDEVVPEPTEGPELVWPDEVDRNQRQEITNQPTANLDPRPEEILPEPETPAEEPKVSRVRSSPLFKRKLLAPDINSLAGDLVGKMVAVWNVDNYRKAETCFELAHIIGNKVLLAEFDFTNPCLDELMNFKVDKDLVGKKVQDIGMGLLSLGRKLQPAHAVKLVSKKHKRIAYLPAGNDLGVVMLSDRYASVKVYSDLLRHLRGLYSTVIIDAEISRDMPTTSAALSTAEVLLIPVQNEEQVARYDGYKGLFDADMIFCRPETEKRKRGGLFG